MARALVPLRPTPSLRWSAVGCSTGRRLAVGAVAVALFASCSGGSDDAVNSRDGGRSPASSSESSTTESAGETTEPETTTTEAPTTTTEAPTTTTTTAPPPPTEPPPPPIEEGALQAGSEGPRTLQLQENLRRLKFDPGTVDGQFGSKTTMAVWAYQALHGLPKDGIVTPELEAQIAGAQPAGMMRPDLGPTHTEVDLDRQVMLVFGDGALELVTHVSTGSGVAYCEQGSGPNAVAGREYCGDASTPTGDYRYQRRIAGERRAPLGTLYSPVYFNGGIAVHGAPSVPNHPASHGCVRIPMHISSYFQTLVVDGEPIAVFRGGGGPAGVVSPTGAAPQAAPEGAENGG